VSKVKSGLVAWGLLPVALVVAVAVFVARSDLLSLLRAAPPVEEITFDRVTVANGGITIEVVNGGPDPVTVAQVTVDDAFWTFTMTPSNTVPRLGRATITIPYPWVQDEAHEITLLSSTGVTFSHEIPVATVTPPVGPLFFGVFAIIGLYVGVIPVAIGLLWYPFLKRLERKWTHFVLALTAGLLIFLGVDALEEALEAAQNVAGAYQGSAVVLLGVVGTVLLLQSLSRRSLGEQSREGRRVLAYLVAVGIGLHNLGEGLAIGASYSLGEVALGAFLIIGFMLHNTTEGLAIVSPVAKDRPKISTLISLGLVAGGPTILGAWLGGMAYSPFYATLFLSIGAGAIVQVVLALHRMVAAQTGNVVWTPLNASGLMVGLLMMYGTGLLVAS
jgi:zinc transporter ZupT